MNKILILTNKEDIHTDLVIRELRRRDKQVIRLHPDEFPTRIRMSYQNNLVKITISDAQITFDSSEIQSVWYRRPRVPVIDSCVTNPVDREFACRESEHFIENFYVLLENCRWMNPLFAGRRARNKLLQMQIGRQYGFLFPKTIVTNDPVEARTFIESCTDGAVYKSVRVGLLHEPDRSSRLIFTTKLKKTDMKRLEEIRFAPCTFQEYVQKDVEIRATVVEKEVFACAIHSQELPHTSVDWRHGGARFESWILPDNIRERLISMTYALGLVFGAFDLILTKDGRYVMLEVNPNGQWAFVEGLVHLPISRAITDYLAKE